MFDAGAIEARLTVDTSQFNRDMAAAEARVKRFEDEPHKIKVSAVFDNASTPKARQAFSLLDQAISKDAMSRLRSSPNGSVLGALNALFSPHPVTGAPSPQQAAQQGLLGKIISSPGGGGTAGPVSSSSQSNTVSRVLGTNTPGGNNNSNTTTVNRVNTMGSPGNGGSVTTKVKMQVDPASAAKAKADAEASGDSSGKGWARSFLSSVGGLFGGKSGKGAVKAFDIAGGGTGDISGNAGKNLIGAAGPGIGAMSFKAGSILGLGGAALGAIPALLGTVGALGGAGLGLGVLGLGFKGVQSQISPVSQAFQQAQAAQAAAVTPQQVQAAAQQMQGVQQQIKALSPAMQTIFQSEQKISNWWQGFTGSLAPLFAKGMAQVSSLLTGLTPVLHQVFGAAGTLVQPLIGGLGDILHSVLPPLAGLLRSVAPLLRPLLDGFGKLVSGLLPGITTALKSAGPAIAAFSSVLGTLGGDVGKLFADAAPVMKSSALIFKDLLDIVAGLFPIIGKLTQIFAAGMAPVFDQFSKIVQALLPFLVQVGSILASLAGAALADLVSLMGALATILKGVSPAFAVLAKALGNVFQVMENSSVFEILANAIENMAGPLAKLVSALVKGLVPILPPIINFVGQLAAILATQLSNAIVQLLPPLTTLATAVLQALAAILPAILPALTTFITLFTQYAVVDVVTALAKALNSLLNAMPPGVLEAAAYGITAVYLALKGMAAVSAISGGLGFLTTLRLAGPVIAAVASSLVGLAVRYVATAAAAVAGAAAQVAAWVATAAAATVAFIAENAAMLGIGVAIAALIAGIIYMATHWQQVWTDIKNWTDDAWHWVDSNVFQPMINWFTQSLPHAFDLVIAALKSVFVTPFEQQFNTVWSFVQNVGTSIGNFFTKTLPGWWDTSISFLQSHFVTPFQNGLAAAYNWVVRNVADPIENLFTKTLPGWFGTAVSAISGLWGKVEGVVLAPVRFVVDSVLDPLINLFDDVTNAVGLGKPIPTIKLARGGKLPGFGGGDVLPALLEPGEAVIDKDKAKQYAWLFKMMGVPGFAGGGVAGNPPAVHGGGNPKAGSNAPGTFGSTLHNIIGGGIDMGKAILAIATGNPTALANAVTAMFGKSSAGGMGGVLGQALLGMPAKLVGDFAHWIIGTNNTATSQGAGGGATLRPTGTGSTVQALMKSMAASVGWTGAQWTALNNVEMREAGYNTSATNPSSGAYGLAQFISGASEYASYGGNATTAAGQIIGMLNYIKDRYGNPEAAWLHEQDFGWYDQGGYLKPGYTLAYNGTGRPERVIAPHQEASNDDILDALERLISVTGGVPAGVGRHVGGALNSAASDASFSRRYPRGGW